MTGYGRINCHPFALTRTVGNHAGELVPEHERVAQFCIADAGLTEPVQVRAADADGLHAYQRLARSGFRLWFGVHA